MKRKTVREHVASEVLRLSNYKCFYCGATFTQKNPPTLDHIVPVSKGGTNETKNLVAACAKCNQHKGSNDLGSAFSDHERFEAAVKLYLNLSDFELKVLRIARKVESLLNKLKKQYGTRETVK